MTHSRTFRLTALAAPLMALALASCGDAPEDPEVAEVAAIAPISAPDGQNWTQMYSESPEGGYVMGNPEAPIKLVEYASHTCPHCADFAADAAEKIRDDYVASGRVSYELRNQIHDPIDLTFSTLARCGGASTFQPLSEQGWKDLAGFFEKVQGNQSAYEAAMQQEGGARMVGIAQATGMLDWFAARGLNEDQAKTCLNDQAKVEAIVKNSQDQSEKLDVTGTPTFFINGRNLGTLTWPELEANLQNAGAR